jgi:hypothetical protein
MIFRKRQAACVIYPQTDVKVASAGLKLAIARLALAARERDLCEVHSGRRGTVCMIKCTLCHDIGWVCETHPGKPWNGPNACPCGAACPWCNQYDDETPPRMPEGFLVEIDKDGSRD